MTIRYLQILVEVCEKNSISAAADNLMISQPSVSQAILQMERNYGIKLFDRIGNRLYVTDDGKSILSYAKHICSLFTELESILLSRNKKSVLRIGSSITIGTCLLPGYIASFSKIHPEADIHVHVENSAFVEQMVLDNVLDLALVEGIVSSSSLLSIPFMDDNLVLVCGQGHPLSSQTMISPAELSSLNFILREPGSGAREIFEAVMLSNGLPMRISWECSSTEAIKNAVQANLGVTVIAQKLAQQEINSGLLHPLQINGINFERKFYIIHHKNKYITPTAKSLMDLILTQNIGTM